MDEPQVPPLRFASVGMTKGGWSIPRQQMLVERTADPSTPLRFGRDDKGRVERSSAADAG